MAEIVIKPRIRGFICTTSHPDGCAANVKEQLQIARAARNTKPHTYRVLVIGSSTGYGLASRIAAASLYDADTIGVFYERVGEGKKSGTPGYYNTAAFHAYAKNKGLTSININGDAFSHEIKQQTIDQIKTHMEQVDLVIYSLASPRRLDPDTGEEYRSDIRSIGDVYVGKTIDLTKEFITEVTVEPATEEGIRETVAVMGGDDLNLWTDALLNAGVLAEGAQVVPFSYIGPEVTYPIYRNGTIGRAKEHLEATTAAIHLRLQSKIDGAAYISVNKAVITQASAAIPVVPLYISLLYKIMKERNVHEAPIHQMVRLLTDHIGPGQTPALDEKGRIRLDDREMVDAIQNEIDRLWPLVNTDNFRSLSDYDAYKKGFRQLFGFEVDGIDYDTPVEIETEA
jgi:enoyl-[acyl-carrier protein] reductase/trans-2-enoyl-CoA reductase (NAD+)